MDRPRERRSRVLARLTASARHGRRFPAAWRRTSTTLHSGRARGHLVGGNLAILCALLGTPYEPDYRDAMLVVEDVNEAVYLIGRRG